MPNGRCAQPSACPMLCELATDATTNSSAVPAPRCSAHSLLGLPPPSVCFSGRGTSPPSLACYLARQVTRFAPSIFSCAPSLLHTRHLAGPARCLLPLMPQRLPARCRIVAYAQHRCTRCSVLRASAALCHCSLPPHLSAPATQCIWLRITSPTLAACASSTSACLAASMLTTSVAATQCLLPGQADYTHRCLCAASLTAHISLCTLVALHPCHSARSSLAPLLPAHCHPHTSAHIPQHPLRRACRPTRPALGILPACHLTTLVQPASVSLCAAATNWLQCCVHAMACTRSPHRTYTLPLASHGSALLHL
jgi:hypothetical protein